MKQNYIQSEYQFRARAHSSYNPENEPSLITRRRRKKIGRGRGRPPKHLKIIIRNDSSLNCEDDSTVLTGHSFNTLDSPDRLAV